MERNKNIVLGIVVVAVIIVAIVYAVGHHAAVTAPATGTTTDTTSGASTVTRTTTGVVTTGVTTTPTQPGTIGMASTTPQRAVTTNDNGKTVVFKRGEEFVLDLGALTWNLTTSNPSIISQIPSAAVASGSQGTYVANNTGTTVLSGTGAPICKTGEACPQFREEFTVNIVVGS